MKRCDEMRTKSMKQIEKRKTHKNNITLAYPTGKNMLDTNLMPLRAINCPIFLHIALSVSEITNTAQSQLKFLVDRFDKLLKENVSQESAVSERKR